MTASIKNIRLSVAYSFQGRWEESIRRGNIRVFFRKRRPVSLPSRVFFYLGSPVKSIIGCSDVEAVNEVTLCEAISIRGDGAITEKELIEYIGEKESIHAIWIGAPMIFNEPYTLEDMNREFGFNPPQSFSIVGESFDLALSRKL